MPKLNFIHICDYASISIGGKINVLGIFENIFSNSLEFTHSQLYIVTNVSIEKSGNFKQIIKIIKEKDNSEIAGPIEFNITQNIAEGGKIPSVGFIAQLNNIKFTDFGNYKVQLFINEEKIGEKVFTTTKLPEKK